MEESFAGEVIKIWLTKSTKSQTETETETETETIYIYIKSGAQSFVRAFNSATTQRVKRKEKED